MDRFNFRVPNAGDPGVCRRHTPFRSSETEGVLLVMPQTRWRSNSAAKNTLRTFSLTTAPG